MRIPVTIFAFIASFAIDARAAPSKTRGNFLNLPTFIDIARLNPVEEYAFAWNKYSNPFASHRSHCQMFFRLVDGLGNVLQEQPMLSTRENAAHNSPETFRVDWAQILDQVPPPPEPSARSGQPWLRLFFKIESPTVGCPKEGGSYFEQMVTITFPDQGMPTRAHDASFDHLPPLSNFDDSPVSEDAAQEIFLMVQELVKNGEYDVSRDAVQNSRLDGPMKNGLLENIEIAREQYQQRQQAFVPSAPLIDFDPFEAAQVPETPADMDFLVPFGQQSETGAMPVSPFASPEYQNNPFSDFETSDQPPRVNGNPFADPEIIPPGEPEPGNPFAPAAFGSATDFTFDQSSGQPLPAGQNAWRSSEDVFADLLPEHMRHGRRV